MTANRYGISFGGDRNIWELDVGDACTMCEYVSKF
jgi:hypothetical protein